MLLPLTRKSSVEPLLTYEKIEQEKQAHINEMKRKNPEHLMNIPGGWQKDESPGWKIWKYLY